MKALLKALVPQSMLDARKLRQFRAQLGPVGEGVWSRDEAGLPADDPGIERTVAASLDWIARAQDCSTTQDGGVARDFSLLKGWGASYPETTGYIIPTLLDAAATAHRPDLHDRARRMLDWLVAIQLPGGGFQGGTVAQRPVVPVSFNTGQILLGLAAGVRAFGDAYLPAMHAAARFLRDSQDPDGAWRRHPTPFTPNTSVKAYETHVAWGLFEADRIAPHEGYGEAGMRQVRWALTRQQPNGWVADNDLDDPRIPLTHTIGYAVRGVVEAWRWRPEPDLLAAARRSLDALLGVVRADGFLPGRLDARWSPVVDFACLTGSVQLAACWLLTAEAADDPRYADAARRVNRFARRTVALAGEPDIVGGVKGSQPVWGEYMRLFYPNWAAKFFIDAQRLEAADPPP